MVASLCANVSSHVVQVAGVCSLKMGLWQSSATWCGWATPSTMCRAPGTTVPFIVERANATMICCSCSEGELLPHSPSDSHATTLALGVLLYVISTHHGSYEAALYISKVMVKMTLQSMPRVTTSHQSVIVNLSVLFHKLPGEGRCTQLSCDYTQQEPRALPSVCNLSSGVLQNLFLLLLCCVEKVCLLN